MEDLTQTRVVFLLTFHLVNILSQKAVYLHEPLFNFFISLLMDWRDVYHLIGDFSPPPEEHDLQRLKRSYICVWLREVIWLVLMR